MIDTAMIVSATLVASGSVGLAWQHFARVERFPGANVVALDNRLKKVELEARAGELAKRSPKGTWLRDLGEAIAEAGDDPLRTAAAANDALADAAFELEARVGWPKAGVRISAFGALLLAIAGFMATRDVQPGATILVVGAGGALACLELGRRAKDRGEKKRRAIDGLVKTLLGPLANEQEPLRRRHRV